jgi:predicted RND superfamily exporter protein
MGRNPENRSLKTDIHGEFAHLSKWMAATAITMVIGFGGMILSMMSRLPHA